MAPPAPHDFSGEILMMSLNDIQIWINKEGFPSELDNNLKDGHLNISSPFGIEFEKDEQDALIIPEGSYPSVLVSDDQYLVEIHLQ